VCAATDFDACLDHLLRDPLIQLVMASDGVTERDMIALWDQVRRDLAARDPAVGARQNHDRTWRGNRM
jgi:hypothetical protein